MPPRDGPLAPAQTYSIASTGHILRAMLDGITITTAMVALLNVLVGGLLVAIVRSRPALKKIAADREANLLNERAEEMERMRERLTALEHNLENKDRQLAEALLHQEKEFAAERALYRHRINNLDQAFSALLMLLKKGVSVEEAVSTIEELRAEQLAREAAEAATIRAAGVKAVAK